VLIALRENAWRLAARPVSAKTVAAVLLLACALFMFANAKTPPVFLWDESRLAVNALEMHQRGWSLVTTYGFVPDLWNTKPPLMIWLMNASMSLFGPSELSMRLPSMAAALGTLLVVFCFVRKVTHSVPTAALAMTLLGISEAFYGEHGARTGDYDSLLCFFTTSYLCLLYFAVHQQRPRVRLLAAAGVLIALAALTKTIAGLVPGAGVALYLLVSNRSRRALETPRYGLMLAAGLTPLAVFYLAREWLAPGYLHAVWFNDFVGRYQAQLGPVHRPLWFFLQLMTFDWMFSAGPLAFLAPLGLIGCEGQTRRALVYSLCCVATELFVISVPATRLPQYMLPALPWLAIACAITAVEWFRRISRPDGTEGTVRHGVALALVAVAMVSIALPALRLRYDIVPSRAVSPEGSYGAMFASLHDQGIRGATIIEPGRDVSGLRAYAPQLRFYALLWNERGMKIERSERLKSAAAEPVVGTCNPEVTGALIAIDARPVGPDGCVVVVTRPHAH